MAFNNGYFDEVRSSILADVAQEKIKDKARWPIFVYDWINKTPNTEAGLKEANEPRNRHYQWSEIIKGNESVYISPMGATTLVKHQGTGDKLANGKIDGSYYDVKYSKDNSVVYYGMKVNNNGGNTFSTTSFGGYGDFTTISDEESIVMRTTLKVSKDLLTKFFFIPDVAQITENYNEGKYDQDFNDNDIYYIFNYVNYYNENTGEFLYSEITFTNIQQQMSQSGQIIEQHIYLSSPGAGYLVPKILFDENGVPLPREKGWEWNTNFTKDLGVKTIQIEVSGNYAICALEIWGYPVDPNHNDINDKRWYAPRKLLVEHFRLPLNENFYKVSPNNAEFVIADGKLTATADLKSYKLMVQNFAGDAPMDYQGIINTTKETSTNTNVSGYTINDQQFGYNDDFVNDSLQTDGKTKNTDLDEIYTADSQWFYDGQKDDGTDGIGIKKISLKDIHRVPNNDHSAVQMLNIMSFALQPVNRLPYEVNSKLTWSTQDFPGFGGFVNKALFGMSPTWRTITSSTNILMPKLQTLPMLMNKKLYDVATNSVYESNALNPNNAYFAWDLKKVSPSNEQTTLGKIPMDFFQKSESDRLGAVLSNKSNSTSITFTLTDKMFAEKYNIVSQNDDGQENISSILLNQIVDSDKYKVKGDSFSTPALEDDSNVLTDVNGDRYIITNIGIKGIGDGDVRITTFNDDVDNIPADVDYHEYINFQTYMKTTASYKNNQVREWFTNLNTSYLDFLDKYINEKFDWPNALPQPQPEYHLPDIIQTRSNISDYGIWRNPVRITSEDKTSFTYTENNKDPNSIFLDSSLNIELYDFADNGYTNITDVKRDYEKISYSSDKLNFALTRLFAIDYNRGWLSNLEGNPGNNDGTKVSDLNKEKVWNTLQDSLYLNRIPEWDGKELLDESYVYKNNTYTNFTGSYKITWGKGVNEAFVNTTSKNRSGWYYFLYFRGTKLYLNVFYESSASWLSQAVWDIDGYVYTSLLWWLGGKDIDDVVDPDNWPKFKNDTSWPTPNEQLLGHKTNYWNIQLTISSYKLKKEKN